MTARKPSILESKTKGVIKKHNNFNRKVNGQGSLPLPVLGFGFREDRSGYNFPPCLNIGMRQVTLTNYDVTDKSSRRRGGCGEMTEEKRKAIEVARNQALSGWDR